VWPLWITAGWLSRVGHKSRGGHGCPFLVGPPGGVVSTGRRARGKRLVFEFHSHHHHLLTD
ncbi:hypothetical protein, partial [Klebsiella quasipneumoniae]|uniref:hypothetical protein n=1 Tax=Klebsiella quasipneumoniae TaxID=1463165 RepID=UPI00352B4095